MIRITENENKEIRKMYGLITEATSEDCNSNIMEFKEFRLWCVKGTTCKNYKIKPSVPGKPNEICNDQELIKAYKDKKLYDEFKKWQELPLKD